MYPLLRRGDQLPTVAAAQILINRAMRRGEQIAVDGIFGSKTQAAVRDFQRGARLNPDGIVGEQTWKALIGGQNLEVVDAVDVTNPRDLGVEDEAIRAAGGDPIASFGMCRGVRVVVDRVMARGGAARVVLLRFHGHGAPGYMGLTVGTGEHATSEFGLSSLDVLVRFLARMRPIFCPFGSAELHGCRVGAGIGGRRLIQGLSFAWGVPVTAGLRTQYGGGFTTFRFEGPTITALPNGGNLRSWARSLPESALMSVNR